jgi:cytochrome c553
MKTIDKYLLATLISSLSFTQIGNVALAAAETERLYAQRCASCHGANRLGGIGPALLPENLNRLRRTNANIVIKQGAPATQMPAFGDKLTDKQIQALVDYIYTPLPEIPVMDMAQIKATHLIHAPGDSLPKRPAYKADPLNLFIVVELGDHHATVLDGDRLAPIHRFPTRFALHGGPKYSSDGRFVYLASRDGWISKFDMYNLKTVAEIRAGINTRNLALSGDDRYVMVANDLPHTLVVLEARDLSPVKVIDVRDETSKTSRVSAVYAAPPRDSFIAALKDIKEVWEIPYNIQAQAQPVSFGPIYDYRRSAGETKQEFPIQRIKLSDYLYSTREQI